MDSRQTSRRIYRLLSILFVFSVAMALPLARGAEPSPSPSSVRFRLPADPSTLDWSMARSSHETYVIMNLMEGLVEEGPDLKPRPSLAERWEISPDGKTYTFHLRQGVKWSDGRPLKASDFEDSWFRLIDSKTHSSYADFLSEVEGATAFHDGKLKDKAAVGIKAVSDGIFQVKLRRRVSYFLHLPTFWVTFPVRLDLIRKHGAQWMLPGKLVTIGPYLLSKWERGKSIELLRNRNYQPPPGGNAPAIERVEVTFEPDELKARASFEEGALDFLLNATTEDLISVRGKIPGGGPRLEQYPYLATYYLGFNIRSPVLRNVETRKALALAIDREGIPSVLQGGQLVAKSWLPPEMEGHDREVRVQGSLYDARAALAKAGHPEGRRLPELRLLVEKFDGAEAVASFIAKSVQEKLGVTVVPVIGSPSDFQRTLSEKKAALFLTHWGADVPDPVDFFRVFTKSSGTNYTGWSNAEYDRRMVEAQTSEDPAARQASYATAEEILVKKEIVIVPLFYKRNSVLLGARVDRFRISPLNYLFLKDVSLKASEMAR